MSVETNKYQYPEARRSGHVDIYHGLTVPDPYRWLEEDSPERKTWLEAERKLFDDHAPDKETIRQIHERLSNYPPDVSDGVPYVYGKRTFFTRFIKGQNYQQKVELLSDGSHHIVYNPNKWDEAKGSPAGSSLSPRGTFIASGRSLKGNDRKQWRVIETATGDEASPHYVETFQGGVTWRQDESGFFYMRTFKDNRRAVYFHKVGSGPDRDIAYFTPDEGDTTWYGHTLSDNNEVMYVLAFPHTGGKSIMTIDLTSSDWTPSLLATFPDDREASSIWYENGEHILVVNQDSPRGRIVRINSNGEWSDVVPESKDTLLGVEVVAQRIVINYYSGTRSYLKIFTLDGTLIRTELPDGEVGTMEFSSQDIDNPEGYIYTESPIHSPAVYSYNVITGERHLAKKSEYNYDPEAFDVSLSYAESIDGTQVPLFICRAKDTPQSSGTPTILYGYGGFQYPLTPNFDTNILPWLEAGGVYVTACLRGGGEYGEKWHAAGTKLHKQRVFDDYIACAEKLISDGITSPDHLILKGESNGGLLVSAVMNQRPDIARVVLPGAALLDMLRFDKGEQTLAGKNWQIEYGSTDNEDEFRNLLKYSPVHNVQNTRYPSVLVSVGEDDDRVRAWNSYKFVAALQAAQQAENIILMNVELSAGHILPGYERDLGKRAMQHAFLFEQLGMTLEK